MADPLGVISAATTALNAVAARFTTFLDQVDARVNAAIANAQEQLGLRQAVYDALAGDMVGVVTAQIAFDSFVDPDEAAPTRIAGGTFLTVAEVFAAAPSGCHLRIRLLAGKTHPMTVNVGSDGRDILVDRYGDGDDPALHIQNITGLENGSEVYTPAAIIMDHGGSVRLSRLDIQFAPLANDALWSAERRGLVRGDNAAKLEVSVMDCSVVADDGQAMVDVWGGCNADVNAYAVGLDGVFMVRSEALGLARVANQSVTLTNGAAISATTTNVTTN